MIYKNKILTLFFFTLILFSNSFVVNIVAAEDTQEISSLKKDIKKKGDLLKKVGDQIDIKNKEIEQLELKNKKNENEQEKLKKEINSLKKIVSNNLELVQELENSNMFLNLFSGNFLNKFNAYNKIFDYLISTFNELDDKIMSLQNKKIEYEENLIKVKEEKVKLKNQEEELNKIYNNLNKELVKLKDIEAFEIIYDEDATISQEEQEELMKKSGIDQSDYVYVDYIITKESSWNYTATNPISGAYGLCQALPPEKLAMMGEDWETNPQTQMNWCNEYAEIRYGSWEAAFEFWKKNNWW